MTGHDDTVPVRLEPHPADELLAVLRVDRPPVNAFDQRMWDRFDAVTASLHGDTLCRAVVITGGQRHFAAGADVRELLDLAPEQFGARNRVLQRAFHALATAPQITIAAVRGYALGGGCALARPGVTLLTMPGPGRTQRLPRLGGPGRAKELILSGRMVTADEARAIGLVDRVFEDAGVLDAAVTEALGYARGPLALRHAKRAVDAALDLPVEAGLALEADLITRCFDSEDGRRGLRSFVDDGPRKAAFLGR